MATPTIEYVAEERTGESRIGWIALGALGVLAIAMIPGVLIYLLVTGSGVLDRTHLPTLFSTEWYPGEEIFGLVPLVLGTLTTSALGLLIAVPVGLGSVIFFRFYSPASITRLGESTLGVLSGLPSVIFGLFGTVWMVPIFGPSLLVAGVVLAMMILPTFAMLTLAAFRQIPKGTMESGAALGLRREQMIGRLALVVTRPRLIAAAGVSLTRALGEALAVEMVCGNVAAIPDGITAPVRTLTTTLVQEFEYATGAHREALHLVALAVVLLAAIGATLAVRMASKQVSS